MNRLVIQWPRLGPLHINRLAAAHRVLAGEGVEVIALETASDSATYAWRLEQGPLPFERLTVFPGETYDTVSPNRMHVGVTSSLDRLAPDAVHIHSYSTPDARASIGWCRRNRRTAICMAESTRGDTRRHPLREAVKRALVSQFDAAQASGRLASEYITELGLNPDRVFTGYSVVDNEYFASRAAAVQHDRALAGHLPELVDDTPFFLASARFMERKNLFSLLTAYHAYRARSPKPWRLILLGDGVLRPNLEAHARSLGLEGVVMPGWRQIDDLPWYYGLASAFVHTAYVDQWGLVINEAMAAGLPVVASTGAGAAHDLVVDDVNGFRFAPSDVPGLARLLHRVAHEVDLETMATASREIIGEWPLERFGTSLSRALAAGRRTGDSRGLGARAGILIAALRVASSGPRSFHAVED